MIPTMPAINYLIRFLFLFRVLNWMNAIVAKWSLYFAQKIKRKLLLLSIFLQLRHCIILSYFRKKFSRNLSRRSIFSFAFAQWRWRRNIKEIEDNIKHTSRSFPSKRFQALRMKRNFFMPAVFACLAIFLFLLFRNPWAGMMKMLNQKRSK